MKNKFFKSLALALSFATVLSTLPVNAYELDSQGMSIESVEYQNSTDEGFTDSAEVFAEIGSTYQVTIPKVIVLSGESKSAQYQVSAEGDIAGCETIFVKPDNTVNLYSVNKDMQVGTITQDKTGWTISTIEEIGHGLIEANDITAGRWTGTFNFEIFLNRVLGDVISPEHLTHIPGEPQIENVVDPTCTEPGSYDEVIYCADCYEEISREEKAIPALGHDFVEGECTRCDATLPALSVTSSGVSESYNEDGYSISVVSEGNTIEYSLDGVNYTSENPVLTEIGDYVVYYKVSSPGYKTVYGSETIHIDEWIPLDLTKSNWTIYTSSTQSSLCRVAMGTPTRIDVSGWSVYAGPDYSASGGMQSASFKNAKGKTLKLSVSSWGECSNNMALYLYDVTTNTQVNIGNGNTVIPTNDEYRVRVYRYNVWSIGGEGYKTGYAAVNTCIVE